MKPDDRSLLERLLDPATPEDERERLIDEVERRRSPAEADEFRRLLGRASEPQRERKRD